MSLLSRRWNPLPDARSDLDICFHSTSRCRTHIFLVQFDQEGCWEPNSKYFEKIYFSHFLSMQEANRYLLTIVSLYQSWNASIVSRYILVSCMLYKWLTLFYSRYIYIYVLYLYFQQQHGRVRPIYFHKN